jgi:uncharacterized membrane protein
MKHKRQFSHFVLIAAFSIAAMLPAYYLGVPFGPDQAQHNQSAKALYNSMLSGSLYPSLAGGTDDGFGNYHLRFYPPLTYYVLSVVRLIVADWFLVNLITLTLAFFIGGMGVYLFVKDGFDERHALFAAFLYTFAAYHLNEIYNSFLLAEFIGVAILPFCFLFLLRVVRRGRWVDAAALSVAYSLLILTHLPLAIMGSAAMAVFALALLPGNGAVSILMKLSAAVFLAIAMT